MPQQIKAARKLIGGDKVAFKQTVQGVDLTLPAGRRDPIFTVLALTLDQPVLDGTIAAR
jgi:hypothetical protein